MQDVSVEEQDRLWMQHALLLAEHAAARGEVPVGAVLVHGGVLIAGGWNQSISNHDPTAHAEIVALRHAGTKVKNYRLLAQTLYVTLEPCMMCVGALVHARIQRVVYGAADPKTGAVHSVHRLLDHPVHNHRISSTADVLHDACAEVLMRFFRHRRSLQQK